MGNKAFVTLLTSMSYLAGVLVLSQSLRDVRSRYGLVVMVTIALPEDAKNVLRRQRIAVIEVESLRPPTGKHNLHTHDARFADTWTKLRAFGLVNYERIVLLDSDMIVLRNMDELMDTDLRGHRIGAVHVCACNPRGLQHYPRDWIPSNCAYTAVKSPYATAPHAFEGAPRPYSQLNSGTVIIEPSKELLSGIEHLLNTSPKVSDWTFPDQDLLTEYFKGNWCPIPWYYNALRSLRNVHPAMWSEGAIRCLHYIFPDKPWFSRTTPRNSDAGFDIMNRWWWDRFDKLGVNMKKNDPDGWRLVLSAVESHMR